MDTTSQNEHQKLIYARYNHKRTHSQRPSIQSQETKNDFQQDLNRNRYVMEQQIKEQSKFNYDYRTKTDNDFFSDQGNVKSVAQAISLKYKRQHIDRILNQTGKNPEESKSKTVKLPVFKTDKIDLENQSDSNFPGERDNLLSSEKSNDEITHALALASDQELRTKLLQLKIQNEMIDRVLEKHSCKFLTPQQAINIFFEDFVEKVKRSMDQQTPQKVTEFDMSPRSQNQLEPSIQGSANFETNEDQIEEQDSELYCNLCYGPQTSVDEMFSLNCEHYFCMDCTLEYLQTNIMDGKVAQINCMQYQCKEEFTQQDITNVVKDKQPDLVEKFITFKKNIEIDMDRTKHWCPRPECSAVITTRFRLQRKATCQECRIVICLQCGQEWHNNLTCDEAMNQDYAKWVKQEGNVKQCPKCHIPTQLYDGCNHITCCKCKYEWCWLCMEEFKSYDHFGQNLQNAYRDSEDDEQQFFIDNILGVMEIRKPCQQYGQSDRYVPWVLRSPQSVIGMIIQLLLIPLVYFIRPCIAYIYQEYQMRGTCGRICLFTVGWILNSIGTIIILIFYLPIAIPACYFMQIKRICYKLKQR